MTLPAEAAGANSLAEVMQSLSERVPSELAAPFAGELFARVDAGELDVYDPASLALLAADAFESCRVRAAGKPKVVLRNRTLRGTDFLVIDIVNDDMPFLLEFGDWGASRARPRPGACRASDFRGLARPGWRAYIRGACPNVR